MDSFTIFVIMLLPCAFIHGYFTGQKEGLMKGAEGMFEQMWAKGTPVPGKPRHRSIEISEE